MKFLNFMEKRRDPFLKIKLTDLARTLARSADLEVTFAFLSYYKKDEHVISISNYWDELADNGKEYAMKSDVYLRSYGNIHHTNYHVVTRFLTDNKNKPYPQFSKQLFSLMEDLRLEQLAIDHRPGMIYAFTIRRTLLTKRFRERYRIHRNKQEWLDALFCAIYLQIVEKPVSLPEGLSQFKPLIRQFKEMLPALNTTDDVDSVTINFINSLSSSFADMTATYFTMYETTEPDNISVDPFEKPPLESQQSKEVDKGDKEQHSEKLPSWHEESSEEGDNFLQFDLDQGSKTDLIGEGERKIESGDQAFASTQGDSKDSSGSEFDGNTLTTTASDSFQRDSNQLAYGEANRYATLAVKQREQLTSKHMSDYQLIKHHIQPMLKPLQQSIQKTIEQKQVAPRSNLHFGRLNKKLLRVVTDKNPRLFYKKNAPSKKLDVTFTLLVDCSASMVDKMEETKAGLVLFHETLRRLQIPHRIVGFWEDALDADHTKQPNILHEVIPFERSLFPKQGPHIMQLEPEEDNRDGFIIRKAAESLRLRPEKHKLLLVFTDGEPSAFDYTENGVIDTYTAVTTTRKTQIEVIGVFLSNGEAQDKEKDTMKHIYGRQSLIVPSVEEIPGYLTPLLKKLLLQYV